MLQQVNDIKLSFYNRFLKKKIAELEGRTHRKPMNFQAAETIGILFDATAPPSRIFINQYREILLQKEKRVSILGYFDDKQEHKNVIFKYFNNKDLNWYWHPKSEVINEFIATPFDILISLHLKPCPPLEYISSTSQAHLRVGRYHPQKEHCYDLMIDVADEYDLKGFSEQVESMLKRVNN